MTKEEIIKAVKVLQKALVINEVAITKLLKHNVRCNKALADHPTIQVAEQGNMLRLSPIGLINGLLDNDEWRICMCFDKHNHFMDFALYDVKNNKTEYV